VSRRGTIAAAARALGLTSSAVSQQLAVLEREAGTPLIDRSPRGVRLTGAGQLLAGRAEQILELLAEARADLDRAAGSVAGPVRIAAVASAAATFVCGAGIELRRTHPGIEWGVSVAEPAQALALLVAGDVDLAVVDEYDYVPLALPDYVVARQLCVEPLVAVVPERSALPTLSAPSALSALSALPTLSARPRLAELADCDWVMPPDSAACGLAVRLACRGAGFEPRVRWTTDDLQVLMRAVAAGHGVAVLPRLATVTAPSGASAGVSLRGLRDPRLSRRLFAVARASTLTRPVAQASVDGLQRAARAGRAGR
jgi:DNA-binding transcriptional LysR family regulator